MVAAFHMFAEALVNTLTVEVLTSWWALYSSSNAFKTLLHSLYDGLLQWSSLDWCRASASLKLRVISCLYIPLLDKVTAR